MKRIKKKNDFPNPLFEKWVREWHDEAVKRNHQTQHSFAKALGSLRKYPLVLKSGKECIMLQYFGEKLCAMLDKKLEMHKKLTGSANDIKEKRSRLENESNDGVLLNQSGSSDDSTKINKKTNGKVTNRGKSKDEDQFKENENRDQSNPDEIYCPTKGSTAYAILITLYKTLNGSLSIGYMLKKDIIAEAETDPDCGITNKILRRHAGWSAMTVLVTKGFVKQKCSPTQYSLTQEGTQFAKKLLGANVNSSNKDEGVKDTNIIVLDDEDNCNDEVFKTDDIKTALDHEDDQDDDFEKFCKENQEPVITVQKGQHFIFTPMETPAYESQGASSGYQSQNDVNEVQQDANVKKKKVSAKQKEKAASAEYEEFFLLPNNFDIILLVDIQEIGDGSSVSELTKLKVMHEVRSLKVGDFTWIGKCRLTNKELVLPYVIERKRIDDLAASIKDGRYKEQKYRLRQCGLKNVTYMIESFNRTYHGSIPLTSLSQAACNSLIEDNFTVKYTRDLKDSMRYLATMTKILTRNYESKELTSCKKKDLEESGSDISKMTERLMEFNEFNKAAMKTKNYSVKEMMIRQLVQLKGLSEAKAIAIANQYPTPKTLSEAFKKQGENLIADILVDSTTRRIGPAISKTLHQFYTNYNLK